MAAVLLATGMARAQIFAPPVDVSNTPTQSVMSQQIFVDGAGNGVVVWEEQTTADPNVRDVFLAASKGNQAIFGTAVNVSSHVTAQPLPRALIDRNLGVDVVWSSDEAGGRKILFARSTDRGQTFSRHAITGDFAYAPAIAEGNDGAIYVAWAQDLDNDGATDEIFVARSDDSGASFGAPVNVSGTPGHSFNPRVVFAGVRLYVAWGDDTSGADGVYVARSEDGGASFQTPVRMPNSTHAARGVNLAANCCTFVWVVWSEGNNDIRLAQSNTLGATFQTDTPFHPPAGVQVFGPDVAVDNNLIVHLVYGYGDIDNRAVVHTAWVGFGTLTWGACSPATSASTAGRPSR